MNEKESERLFTVDHIQETTVLTPVNVDLRFSDQRRKMRQQLLEFATTERPRQLIVSFERFHPTIVPSQFITDLVRLKDRLKPHGGVILFCSMSDLLQETLQICDPHQELFKRYDSLADAYEAFQNMT
jgi:hypothetical protein